MNNKTVSNLGFIGISLLLFTIVFGGLLIENYDVKNQFISESYAIDTKYGFFLRLLGYIPSGIIITLFYFMGENEEIDINTNHPEFKDWIWLEPKLLPEKAISFKKDVYRKINKIFIPMINNFNASNFN